MTEIDYDIKDRKREMKKIYMRAGVVPYEVLTPEECLQRNALGGNSGNLLYQYSMVKTLSTEGTVVVPNQYRIHLNDADRINEECEMFIIPLADAFRKDFMRELREITELVKHLTIPCVVTGVGLRSTYEPDFSKTKMFDEDVKNFINAVLDKSAMLGLRRHPGGGRGTPPGGRGLQGSGKTVLTG